MGFRRKAFHLIRIARSCVERGCGEPLKTAGRTTLSPTSERIWDLPDSGGVTQLMLRWDNKTSDNRSARTGPFTYEGERRTENDDCSLSDSLPKFSHFRNEEINLVGTGQIRPGAADIRFRKKEGQVGRAEDRAAEQEGRFGEENQGTPDHGGIETQNRNRLFKVPGLASRVLLKTGDSRIEMTKSSL